MKATRGMESLQFSLFACLSLFCHLVRLSLFCPSGSFLNLTPPSLELDLNKNHNMNEELIVNDSMS